MFVYILLIALLAGLLFLWCFVIYLSKEVDKLSQIMGVQEE